MPTEKPGKDEEQQPEPEPEETPEQDPEETPEASGEEAEGPQVPCLHGSHDGQACCAMDCHIADVPARLEELLRRKKAADGAQVEFNATFKGGVMSDEGELKVTLIPNVADPWALHRDQFVGHKGRQVLVFLAFQADDTAKPLPGQQKMTFDGVPAPEPVDTLACATCHRIAQAEGEEPGRICGFCAEGELIITSTIPLLCSECRQPQELSTAQPGDTCTLCKEGRYLAGEAAVVDSCGDLVRFVSPDRVAEIADAVCGLDIQNDRQAKAIVSVGDDRFVVTETTGSDPVSFEAWPAVSMDELEGDHHEDGTNLDRLRVTLGADGAAFVLVGPPVRILVQPEDEAPTEAEESEAEGEAEAEGD